MTIRQLINQLSEVDEDVKDYEVWFAFKIQLTKDIRLAGRARLFEVPENVDVDEKRIFLKAVNQ